MITQYSRVQLTLSEKEKEYAWFSYAAKIIRAGCNDQQMSGYTVTGTGIDGQEIKAELTNEELFQLFSEIIMKYGRKLVTQEMEQHSLDQESDELLKPDITDRPLERRDYQIQITRHELKTRKADVTITWGNNLKVEGLYVASRVRGGVRLSVPVYFVPGGGRMDLITVGQQLQAAVLRAYQQMEHEGKDQCRVSYLADRAAFQVQTKSVAEGTVIGYADMQAGQDLKVHQIRIRRGSDGRLSCMYPAQASGSNENKQWHNLAAELSDGRLHEEILKVFRQEHPREAGTQFSSAQHHVKQKREEPEEEEDWER